MTIKEVANMTVEMIFDAMPEEKKEVFRNACYRNLLLTSDYGLYFSQLTVYKEGFYWKADGTRSGFAVFAKDNDGELEIIRKPKEDKLHRLWGFQWMNEMPIAQHNV